MRTATLACVLGGLACDATSVVVPRVDASAALAISDVTTASIGPREAVIAWTTQQPAVSVLEFGTTASYGRVWSSETEAVQDHRAVLTGLESATTYRYRVSVQDSAGNQSLSPERTFTTAPLSMASRSGIWISPADVAALPMSGSAWNNVLSEADSSCGMVNLADQNQSNNVCIMAKALVFVRTGGAQYRAAVVSAINQIASAPNYVGRALALGRELGAYVVAADLIDLKSYDPVLDGRFRTALTNLRSTYTAGPVTSLIDCHEERPNNWGAHCGATRVAIAMYLDDTADLARAAQVFKGYLGDRSSYAGFNYGSDLSWQCDPTKPVGINPEGCRRNGLSLDGVLADDQRRGGSFTTSPPQENYVWEAMQGLLAQAVLLERAGYTPFEWEDRALLRAAGWLHNVPDFPAQGDDTWMPSLLNHFYGTNFPAPVSARAGKNMGWTDWTHG